MLEPSLTNLRLLGKVGIDDKISIKGNLLYISSSSYTRPLRRFITGNSRETTIKSINSTVHSIIEMSSSLMNSSNMIDTISSKQKYTEHCNLKKMYDVLSQSIIGLENLKLSYVDDAAFVSLLEGVILQIKDQTIIIEEFLKQIAPLQLDIYALK